MSNCQENIPSMNLEPSPSASNSHDLKIKTANKDVHACLRVVHEALTDVKAKDKDKVKKKSKPKKKKSNAKIKQD